MAGAFPISSAEGEWAGLLSDDVKAELKAHAAAVHNKASAGIDDPTYEGRSIAGDSVNRVKQAAQDAVAAAQQKISAASSI